MRLLPRWLKGITPPILLAVHAKWKHGERWRQPPNARRLLGAVFLYTMPLAAPAAILAQT
jgi:hypothetical protein